MLLCLDCPKSSSPNKLLKSTTLLQMERYICLREVVINEQV